jgi:hypothetical protein
MTILNKGSTKPLSTVEKKNAASSKADFSTPEIKAKSEKANPLLAL